MRKQYQALYVKYKIIDLLLVLIMKDNEGMDAS
jgi:hypothetical protein